MSKGAFLKSLLIGVLGTIWASVTLAATDRGISVQLRVSERAGAPIAETVSLYGKSYALVIGNDAYTGGWPTLSMAVKDAEEIAAELETRGFEVTLKKNLDSNQMERVFKEFYAFKGEDPNSRLFVWYAGHGHTMNGEGFLVPTDAPRPQQAAQFRFKSLSMRRFGEFVRLAQSKHAYAVFDSCFAGTVFNSQRAIPPAAITRATTLPVRQFLTSGDADQTVSDDGRFRKLFLRAIRGEERSDLNGDGYVTASELGMFLGDRLTNLTQSRQTPRSGKLRDENYDRGDFVFLVSAGQGGVLVSTARSLPPAGPGAVNEQALELEFWNSIKDSDDPNVFYAYLTQYPRGSFAGLARINGDKLRKQIAALSVPPKPTFDITAMDESFTAVRAANVRARPASVAKKMGTIGANVEVNVTGRTSVGGATWYRVAMSGGGAGYVLGNLLKVGKPLDQAELTRRIVSYYDHVGEWAGTFRLASIQRMRIQERGKGYRVHVKYRYESAPGRGLEPGTDQRYFDVVPYKGGYKVLSMGANNSAVF